MFKIMLGECEQVAEFYELCNIAQYSTFKFCSRDPNFVDGARKKLTFFIWLDDLKRTPNLSPIAK